MLGNVAGVLFNPRIPQFDLQNPQAGRDQIEWEFRALGQADIFSMWFCAETIQPVCMYELGRHLALRDRSRVVVGCHPHYPRAFDVRWQAIQAGHEVISHTLEHHAAEIRRAARMEDRAPLTRKQPSCIEDTDPRPIGDFVPSVSGPPPDSSLDQRNREQRLKER
jgi:hypothetical protein